MLLGAILNPTLSNQFENSVYWTSEAEIIQREPHWLKLELVPGSTYRTNTKKDGTLL